MNTPDRSGPRYDLVDNAVLDASPAFPFSICPRNGFFELTPQVQYTPADVAAEFLVRGLGVKTGITVLAVEDARKIAICGAWLFHFGDGWSSAPTNQEMLIDSNAQLALNEQTTYIVRVMVPDKDNLHVAVLNYGTGDVIADATLTVTDLFAGNPTFTVGHPTDAQLVGLDIAGLEFRPSSDIQILGQQSENPGPSAITLAPAVATTAAEVGYWVGNLWATHARSAALPCTFALVTGTGDTDNASFSIRGTNLHVAGTLTAGAKSVRIQATDRYGATFAAAKTITVS